MGAGATRILCLTETLTQRGNATVLISFLFSRKARLRWPAHSSSHSMMFVSKIK
jgi:hypothetical protein